MNRLPSLPPSMLPVGYRTPASPSPYPQSPAPRDRSPRFLVFGLMLPVITIIAVLTNPKPEDHRAAVKEAITMELARHWARLDEDGLTLGSVAGRAVQRPIINFHVETMIHSHNYFVCSTTFVSNGKATQTIGIGVFGQVFVSQKFSQKFSPPWTNGSVK